MVSMLNDGFDVVYPKGNEKEFIEMALYLGYKELVFLTDDIRYVKPADAVIKIKTAYLVSDVSQIQRARQRFDYLFAKAERKFFESDIDFIFDAELSDRRDSFHYRSTSLNQVHAGLAKSNDAVIVFNFSNLMSSPYIMFGRMSQNDVLVRKYRLRSDAFSMARRPIDMKSRTILDALLNILGERN